MDRKYLLLNITLFIWFFAILAWGSGAHMLAQYAGLLAVITFVIFLLKGCNLSMFKKHKTIDVPNTVATSQAAANEKTPVSVEKQVSTVIASDVHFEGNMVCSSPVYIHGSVNGNIDAKDSMIKVLREGRVEGNLLCRELIIDGTVIGQCMGDTVEIYENGMMTGTLAYRTLAVKKGGQFSGQAEVLAPVQEKTNVVGLVIEPLQEPTENRVEETRGQKKSQHPAG